MPKVNTIQTSFHGGEFSPMLYGQVHAERFKSGLQVCLNYYPTLQGPLIRRPGTKYVNNVKDSTSPPSLVPFIFSQTQSYALEFGDRYIRFYANGGQLITSSNQFKVAGFFGYEGSAAFWPFDATRDALASRANEGAVITASSLVAAGSVLEIQTPYSYLDAPHLKYVQNNDTLYITHPNYPTYKLQRYGHTYWDLKPVIFQDGPYLPYNSYKTTGDSTRITLTPSATGLPVITTGPSYGIYGAANNGAGLIRLLTASAHAYRTGDTVFVAGVPGTTEANNGTSSIRASYWTVSVPDSTHLDLIGSTFSNVITGSAGVVSPALFQMLQAPNLWGDCSAITTGSTVVAPRVIGFINAGFRYWGSIFSVTNASRATVIMGDVILPDTSVISIWQMGAFSGNLGFPSTCCFHQDRLSVAGSANLPQRIDASMSGEYEQFATSGSSLQVSDNNAFSFKLLSSESNPVMWLKSAAQGLLAGSQNAEWSIQPSTQAAALTPTNVNAIATSYFGSSDSDAVQAGNATLYVSRAKRKIREMNFFFQVGTFRSTDLTEIAEHITIPTVTKLTVQKETIPLIWGLRSDGNLLSMSYSRDDQTLKAGWSRHQLGGQSDAAGTNPVVKSFCAIPATANSSNYDQVWMVVQRSTLSGSTFTSVEYTTQPFDDSFLQEDAFQGDCGATYDSPLSIFFLTNSTICNVTSLGHGLSNGDQIQITNVIGMNSSVVDSLGNTSIVNLVNEKTFIVASAGVNFFKLVDFNGIGVSSLDYSPYVQGSGGTGQIRKMVKTISGLNWLNGETVGILADGGNHRDLIVQSNSITLDYRAAKVQIGYRFNSDGQSLRQDGGSAQGSAIGETSRMHRVAPQFHNMGDLALGSTFTDLMTVQIAQADNQQADQRTPLATGIVRDSVGSTYDFDGWVCWRQNSMLPGMLQSLTYFQEVQDV